MDRRAGDRSTAVQAESVLEARSAHSEASAPQQEWPREPQNDRAIDSDTPGLTNVVPPPKESNETRVQGCPWEMPPTETKGLEIPLSRKGSIKRFFFFHLYSASKH